MVELYCLLSESSICSNLFILGSIISQLRSIQYNTRDFDSVDGELRPYRYQSENLWGIPLDTDKNLLETIRRAQTRIQRSASSSISLIYANKNNLSSFNSERSTPKRVNFSKSAGTIKYNKTYKVKEGLINSPRNLSDSGRVERVMSWFEGPTVNCAVPHSNLSKYYAQLLNANSLARS